MTAVDSGGQPVLARLSPLSPSRAVTALAWRQVRRGALAVNVVAAGMSVLVAVTYDNVVGAGQQGASLSALAGNPAIRTLFGEPVALDDPGGFTVWRTGTFVAVLIGVWGLLAATRITRGQEDAGHWDLLLAGRVPMSSVVRSHLWVLAAVPGVAGGAVAVALIAAGTDPAGAVLHGAGLAVFGVFFVGVAGLTAQLFPARAAASGAAVAVLGASLLLRMVGDGVPALAWVRWFTPFGLVELTRPYDSGRWLPLLILAVAAGLLVVLAPAVAKRRDLRGGWLSPAVGRSPRLALLGSVPGFAVRRTLRPLAGWSAGIAAYFLLIGLVAKSMTGFLTDNPGFADLAAQAGFAGLGRVEGYAATLFALLAIPVGVFTAVRIAASATAETDRLLTLLYAGPVTRRASAGAEVLAAAGGAVVLTLVAGLATWAGTAIVGAGLSLGGALAGCLNVLPVVALCLGAAVFALGVRPRAVAWIGAFPAVGGFLLLVLAVDAGAPAWVVRLSPFAHLAPVPDRGPDWAGAAGMMAVALALCLAGVGAYERRDLRG